MKPVRSWGRLSAEPHHVLDLNDPADVPRLLAQGARPGLAYGMGRSYGDVCLNPGGTLWRTGGLDRFIAFDDKTGRLLCEAGVLLRDILRLIVPRGWMLPVTPGTQWVTIGGAIANDVHGKNHHRMGSFGDHVRLLTLLRTDGTVVECGPDLQSEWFAATVGGMGLTGVITQAEIQLCRISSAWLETETLPFADLTEFFHLADYSEADWQYTVSWIDCFTRGGGRGLFMRGNPSLAFNAPPPKSQPRTVPFVPPVSLVNRLSLRPFNMAYYYYNKLRISRSIRYYESFFYPLDNLFEWNRIYGPHGFFQYQSVVPRDVGQVAIQAMLNEIARSGEGSFLAVLKTFGARHSCGMMGFPQPGVTLALDFPNHGSRTSKLFDRLDGIVREAKGRLYPAKDARMPKELFEKGYPRLFEFVNYRDPGISSSLSRRLMGY